VNNEKVIRAEMRLWPLELLVSNLFAIMCASNPDISHYLSASRRRISESRCATATFERFEERPDADRV
jgi:hypothetical protein